MDKRDNTRIVFNVNSEVTVADRIIGGEVQNLSLKGMFLKTHEKIPADTALEIVLNLSGSTSELKIVLSGTVVRLEDNGFAVRFDAIDLDSFIHLRNIIAYNEGDEEKIMKEFYKSIKSE